MDSSGNSTESLEWTFHSERGTKATRTLLSSLHNKLIISDNEMDWKKVAKNQYNVKKSYMYYRTLKKFNVGSFMTLNFWNMFFKFCSLENRCKNKFQLNLNAIKTKHVENMIFPPMACKNDDNIPIWHTDEWKCSI